MKRIALIAAAALLAASGTTTAHAGHGKGKGKGKHQSMHIVMGGASGPLGVGVTSMTEELRGYFGAPKDAGILVSRVEADRPAAKAGVKVGDVIISVDGDEVEQPWDVWGALAGKRDGDRAKLVVIRKAKRRTLTVELDDAGFGGMRFGLGDDFDFDFDFDVGGIAGLPHGVIGAGGVHADKMEKLERTIERLEKKIEKLERRLAK